MALGVAAFFAAACSAALFFLLKILHSPEQGTIMKMLLPTAGCTQHQLASEQPLVRPILSALVSNEAMHIGAVQPAS
jgi:hypothetical protein